MGAWSCSKPGRRSNYSTGSPKSSTNQARRVSGPVRLALGWTTAGGSALVMSGADLVASR
jgi:hypothetical protein